MKNSRSIDEVLQKVYLKAIILVFGLVYIILHNVINYSSLYVTTPDGNLYLSIADNFWKTGHFIQNARPYEIEFVVPFGLPLILTLLRIIFRDIWGIIAIQYVLYLITGHLIGKSAKVLFVGRFANDNFIRYGGGIAYLLGALLYWLSVDILKDSNPATLLTEVWTSCLISLFIYFVICKDNRIARLVIACVTITIRPAFYPFLIYEVIEILVNWKRSERDQKKKIVIIFMTFLLLLCLNVINNYRETKQVVLFENYSGLPLYQANNPSTKTYEYSSSRVKEFVSEDDTLFWETFNSSLPISQKSKIYRKQAGIYIGSHLKETLQNVISRIDQLFWMRWGAYSKIALLAFFLALIKKRKLFYLGLVFYLIAFTTGFGLNISRYSIFILPYYLVMISWFIGSLVKLFPNARNEKERATV